MRKSALVSCVYLVAAAFWAGGAFAADSTRVLQQSAPIHQVDSSTLEAVLKIPAPLELRGDKPLALALQTTQHAEEWVLFLDGQRVEYAWTRTPEGWAIRIPNGAVVEGGVHHVRITAPQADASASSIEVFTLEGSFEEIHFNHAMAPKSLLKAQPTPHPTQPLVDVQHYDLTINLNMTSTALSGELTMDATVLQDLTQFAFDLNPNGGLMTVSRVDQGVGTDPLTFAFAGNFLVVTLPEERPAGDNLRLRVQYGGTPAVGGVFGAPYRVTTHNTVPILYTFSEPYGARNWWPCKDLPDDKASMSTRIVCDEAYTVVSNGLLTQQEDLGTTKRWSFTSDFPMATYLFSICATNYQYVGVTYNSRDGQTQMPLGHYLYPESFANEQAGVNGTLDAMEFFSELFGEYPFIMAKYATATHPSGSGMEHTTCTSMPINDVGIATGSPEPGKGRRNIHELAHHWFGNSITAASFDHLWLNEGFATWCEAIYYEDDGASIARYHEYIASLVTSGVTDTVPLVGPGSDAFAGSNVYRRGALVLHMLRGVMGQENLLQAIRNYLNRYEYSVAVTEEFQAECEAVYGGSLEWFFETWCYGVGRPTYSWSYAVSGTPGDYTLQLQVQQTQAAPMANVFQMPIEIVMTTLAGETRTERVMNNARTQSFSIPLGDFEPWTVSFDPQNWILKRVLNTGASAAPELEFAGFTNDGLVVRWSGGVAATEVDILTSADAGVTWNLAGTGAAGTTSRTLTGLAGTQWVRVRGREPGKTPSALSDTYAARDLGSLRILVVEGYDRWPTQGRGATHAFAASTGESIAIAGVAFDCCTNEQVITGAVALANYPIVVWILGEESTATETFSAVEQALVRSYMDVSGGRLFVSGAEVAYDLDRTNGPTTADRAFLNDVLRTNYISDDSLSYSTNGESGSLFADLSFTYDNGSAGIYFADYPDVVEPINESLVALRYATGTVAGTHYGDVTGGRVVFLGFGFETIYPAASRDDVMQRVLTYFGAPAPARVDWFMVY